jgi:predicted HicB family RNase H-like nuclease
MRKQTQHPPGTRIVPVQLRFPKSLTARLTRCAEAEGVSLNRWITERLSEWDKKEEANGR